MSVLSRLTVTPLLYACGALVLLCLALGAAVWAKDTALDSATSKTEAAEAQRDEARTAADAWKGKADGCVAANEAYADVVGTLNGELELAQAERRRLEAEGKSAIAAARAEARDADRTLKRMAAQFQAQSREPSCAAAVARVAQVCPAFEGY